MLIDSHCHLDFPDFADQLDAVVARARAAGIERMVTISTRVRRQPEVLAIADRFAEVYCSLGTHPHYAHEELDVTPAELVTRSRAAKVVAIGEAGLDYHYDNSPREAQERGFRTHIAAARESGLPLVIHSRQADDDTARILEEEMGQGIVLPAGANSPAVRWRSAILFPSRASSPSRTPRPCGRSRRSCRQIAFWLRPMRPIWHRANIAAGVTSRLMWSRPQRSWPRSAAFR
jgi:Tat protein secretion system quality control protein TatD with DNase activity